MTRVGLWGLGLHARKNLLPALAECPSVELAAVTTRNADIGRAAAQGCGASFWSTPEELLDDDLDAVVVATPTGLHREHGLAVLRAGKHLWCEKSLTDRLDTAEELVEEARRRHLCVAEAFMYAYHPQMGRVRGELAKLGPVLTLTCRFGIPPLDAPGYRLDPALGGGALYDVGCYTLHLARKIAGELELVGGALSRDGVDIDGTAHLRSARGASVTLEWGYRRSYRSEVDVWCEKGSVYADRVFSKPPALGSEVVVRDLRGTAQACQVESANHFVAMFEVFARAGEDHRLREGLYEDALAQARSLSRLAAL